MRSKEYINNFFKEDLSIEQIAKEVGLSEYHFFRLFKSVYQLSPHQYIIQKRLCFSKQLLQQEQLPIATVAMLAGFADIHSFSKSFKKYFGFSPSQLGKN